MAFPIVLWVCGPILAIAVGYVIFATEAKPKMVTFDAPIMLNPVFEKTSDA